MSSPLVVAALQLQTLGFNPSRLEFYFKNAHARGAKIIVFGEYVLNHFFKELASMPQSMVKEQSDKHLKLLKTYAQEYDMTIIAPIVIYKKDGFVKTIARINSAGIYYYEQQILIPYAHWDEQSFFVNKIEALKSPMIFSLDGFKIMVMAGYEMHFPPFWDYVRAKKIDLVILPTSSTFGSHNRWREIIKTQAFLYETYILRVNRLGEYSDKDVKWRFYGDSMLVRPDGEVEMMLEDKESMLVEEIDKKVIKLHKKEWKFEQALSIRKELK
ncbi:MAG: carbon-nitrogen hydrolase family protein [Sulfurovaceae bacterium]|nr:carbon-nitrogen hydrolase family protein [Sulfurovaceae bacterium]MDD5548012.1 carbon-nitrogen hydrolase family protein [Sulfurovaceae bacterium]